MASARKFKTMLLGLVVAALLAVAVEASVTVHNPAKVLASVVVDKTSVGSMAELPIVTVDVGAAGEETIQFISPQSGEVMAEVHVNNHDVVVLLPDPFSSGHYLAWRVRLIFSSAMASPHHAIGLSVSP